MPEALILTAPQLRSARINFPANACFPALRTPFDLMEPPASCRHQGVDSSGVTAAFAAFFPNAFMMKATATPKKEITVRKTAASAPQAETQTNESSAPLWKTQHGRVQGAMWKHLQDEGKARFTISISRSYKDKEDDSWKNVHYFDRKDLDDVRSICQAAEEAILGSEGMETVVGED